MKPKSLLLLLPFLLTTCTDYNNPGTQEPTEYAYYGTGTGIINRFGGEVYINNPESPIHEAVCAIKANAINTATRVTVSQAASSVTVSGFPDARIILVEPSDLNLGEDATIGMSYSHLNSNELNRIELFRLIPSSGELISLDEQGADQSRKILYGKTSKLGYFVILQGAGPTVTTGTFTDTRDQQSYQWVEINGQRWMAENLNFATSSGSWCYQGSSSYCDSYGRLYDWQTAASICPPGWHLPDHEEWKTLEASLGSINPDASLDVWKETGMVGKKLKSTMGWNNGGNGTNEVQFNVLPGGFRDGDGTFYYQGSSARFWTATPYAGDYIARYINHDTDGIFWGVRGGLRGMSVRCVMGGTLTEPDLTTQDVTNISGFTAVVSARVESEGSSHTVERGICWNTEGYPLVTDHKAASGSGIGSYSAFLTGLQRNQTYFVRAYAENSETIGYGNQLTFNTLSLSEESDVLNDPRDGKTYPTVRIGDLWWMAENLNFDLGYGSWCYDNATSYCDTYGKLYDWISAAGACPDGWRLPSDDDWTSLERALGMSTAEAGLEGWRTGGDAGKRIKSVGGWYNSGNGTDDTGFNAVPGGFRDGDGTYDYRLQEARFWTTTVGDKDEPWVRTLDYLNDGIYRQRRGKDRGLSVRCVKGFDNGQPTVSTATVTNITGFTATVGGDVLTQGSSIVKERGVCWNTSGYPDIHDTHQALGAGTGFFSTTLYGLNRETSYAVRAYAINNDKIAYGQVVWFNTAAHADETSTLVDTRDLHSYATVKIGNDWWMAENLAYDAGAGSYCYDNLPSNCTEYGRLYEWEVANASCPDGWHLATDTDWKTLETTLGMSADQLNLTEWRGTGDVGMRLKTTTGWYSNGNGTNDARFNVKPSGFRDNDGSYDFLSREARYWTGSTSGVSDAYIRFFVYDDDAVYRNIRGKDRGMAVRCVKNN